MIHNHFVRVLRGGTSDTIRFVSTCIPQQETVSTADLLQEDWPMYQVGQFEILEGNAAICGYQEQQLDDIRHSMSVLYLKIRRKVYSQVYIRLLTSN